MDISSVNSQLMSDYEAQLDTTNDELQQMVSLQQDSTVNNDNVQATQLDAFAMSTIQPYNS